MEVFIKQFFSIFLDKKRWLYKYVASSAKYSALCVLLAFVFCNILYFFYPISNTSATTYTSSITTSSAKSIDIMPKVGSTSTIINSENITVTTNCLAGYNLGISTSSNDNNLYLDGDDTNNTANTYFSPSDGTTSLINAPNTWGFLLSDNTPTENSIFQPVPTLSSPASLKTTSETASETNINDTFPIYYGVAVNNLTSGSYKMAKDASDNYGKIVYYLTIADSCVHNDNYTLSYDANGGTGAPSQDTGVSQLDTYNFTVSNTIPVRNYYTFLGWSENQNALTADYQGGDTFTATANDSTLYAIWEADTCDAGKICYFGNGADAGTMADQSANNNSDTNLIPSNYSRPGYGFAGWNTSTDGTGTNLGPNATITTGDLSNEGMKLYAKWVASAGDLQTWNGCGNLTTGSVTALTDTRDNQTYAVAKLADGKCWTIENLRLVPSSATITSSNTHNPTDNFIS